MVTRTRLDETSDGVIAPDDPNVTPWAEQRAVLAVLNHGGARWLMVSAHELLA